MSSIDEAAEQWMWRLQRGLSLEEEVAFAEWLAADARHEAGLRKYQRTWDRFAPLAAAVAPDAEADPDRFAASRAGARRRAARGDSTYGSRAPGKVSRWMTPLVGLAAAITLLLVLPRGPEPVVAAPIELPPLCQQLTLDDGSTVELNRGAELTVDFTAEQRRVRLTRGEAIFNVAKDPARPFVVSAGTVAVRAVGTAFNVRFDPHAVEVLVTEGQVQIEDEPEAAAPAEAGSPSANAPETPRAKASSPPTLVGAGQRALVALQAAAPRPEVTTLSAHEIDARLLWQPKMLDFDDAPLSEIVGEFNRRNPVRLVVRDPRIANRRMTAAFRSDNLEAFVRLIETNIGVRVERIDETHIALKRR